MSISDKLQAILSIFTGGGSRKNSSKEALDEWFKKNYIPRDWKKYQKKNKRSKDVILNSNKRRGRFLFKGGNSNDERQPRLRMKKGNLTDTAISGGGGVEFYGYHKCTRCYHHAPSERGVKMREGSTVEHVGCLFHGYSPHTILVAGNTTTHLTNCVAVDCDDLWLPMKVKHGPKGPHDNPQGFFKQDGSKLYVDGLTLVNSDLGALRHPDDKAFIGKVDMRGKSEGMKVQHKGKKENIRSL